MMISTSWVRSGWYSEGERASLQRTEAMLRGYAAEHPQEAMVVEADGLMVEQAVQDVFDFLGRPLDAERYHALVTGQINDRRD